MARSTVHQADEKANLWLAGVAFAVAAFALFHGQAAGVALVLMTCGFALVLTRLRQERDEADARRGLNEETQRARELLARGAHRQALTIAHRIAELSQSARLQHAAVELVAWCELGLGRPQAARDALSWLDGSGQLDPYCRAAVEDARGQSLWALHILERAARRKPLSREATLLRIELYARLRGVEAACALAAQKLGLLTRADLEHLLAFAQAANCPAPPLTALSERIAALSSNA